MAGNRIYFGIRHPRGKHTVNVEEGGEAKRLPHILFHSPDGFEWGYGGSGPADLALSILADHFRERYGEVSKAQIHWGTHPSVILHQDFKWAFVARFPEKRWELSSAEIDDWLLSTEIAPAYYEAVEKFEMFKERDGLDV